MQLSTLRMQFVAAAMVIATAASVAAEALNLPARQGPRPETTNGVPHIQIGVAPVPEITADLLARVDAIAHVDVRNTVISLPGAKGFWLEEGLELARPDVIVGGREFAHVHPDGSLHASLDPNIARQAVEAGWATPHPWADQRAGWEGFVMIYTPTTQEELETVFRLVGTSYEFVTGLELTAN